jgi:RNA polymerase sigma-70 factor (ECF subfamily)
LDFSEINMTDSVLQMLFTLCHPSIPRKAQIGLSLRILCGFGIDEIATAFLTNKDLSISACSGAKQKLREKKYRFHYHPQRKLINGWMLCWQHSIYC